MAEKKIDLLNPVGETEVKEQRLAPRPQSLQGLRLGLLDNTKPNAEHFLHRVGEKLREKFGLAEIVVHKKTGFAIPISREAQSALTGCHVLITAFGD